MENQENKKKNSRINLEGIGLKQEKCNSELKQLITKARELMDKKLHIQMSEPRYIRFALYQFSQKLISGGIDLSLLAKE